MKIEDLIKELQKIQKELQKIQKEHGNINVAVQFRDDSCYEGTDSLLLYVEENETNTVKIFNVIDIKVLTPYKI